MRLQGSLKGYDQATNLVLENCHERTYSTTAGVEQTVLGLYIIRGDNMYVCAMQRPRHVMAHAYIDRQRAWRWFVPCVSACSAIIGELDEDLDSQIDLASLRGEPLRPLVH